MHSTWLYRPQFHKSLRNSSGISAAAAQKKANQQMPYINPKMATRQLQLSRFAPEGAPASPTPAARSSIHHYQAFHIIIKTDFNERHVLLLLTTAQLLPNFTESTLSNFPFSIFYANLKDNTKEKKIPSTLFPAHPLRKGGEPPVKTKKPKTKKRSYKKTNEQREKERVKGKRKVLITYPPSLTPPNRILIPCSNNPHPKHGTNHDRNHPLRLHRLRHGRAPALQHFGRPRRAAGAARRPAAGGARRRRARRGSQAAARRRRRRRLGRERGLGPVWHAGYGRRRRD